MNEKPYIRENLVSDTGALGTAERIGPSSGGGGGGEVTPEALSWHQCPEPVRNYIAAAKLAYPASDDVTIINQYAMEKGSENNADTKPVGKTIDGSTYHDNIPNVAIPFATAHKAGTLTALDPLRWINTTSAPTAAGETYPRGKNSRDLGGWTCDGGTIRYGLLIRGGEPNPADKELMVGRIGIKTEVQLLPLNEQADGYKKKSAWGIDWAGNDTTSTSVYTLNDSKDLWRKLLEAIMDSVNHCKAVYFHCGVGADRTGIIATALEAILGTSRSDCDIDYELTNFSTGWQDLPGGFYRGRTYTSYKAIMAQVANVPLLYGLADSFRNRWVSFLLSCGISIDKINAFRAAMIDGTPEMISITVPIYTITNTLNNVINSNAAQSIEELQAYTATLTAAAGYVISAVSITMGGADVSSYYADGAIRIPSVTGNIIITATATAIVRENLLTMDDGKINKRFNATNTESSANGYFVTDFFAAPTGFRIVKGYSNASGLAGSNHYGNCRIGLYDQNKSLIKAAYISDSDAAGYIAFAKDGDDWVRAPLSPHPDISDWSAIKYIRLTLALNNAASAIGAVADVLSSGIKIYLQ